MSKRRPLSACAAALAIFLSIGFVPALPAEPQAQPDLEGRWEGAIQLPGTKLAIQVDFAREEDGGWTGDISIPLQNAHDLPLANIRLDGRKVAFDLPSVPGDPIFRGDLSEDGQEIAGDFTQGGGTFPFELALAASPTEAAEGALAGFPDFVAAAREAWEVPGLAMAIVKDGEVVLSLGFGYRDVEKKLPVTPRTLFAIGSTTKAMTAVVMGTLVDEGKLAWDEPVRKFLPGFELHDRVASELLTPRDLLTHRSGLPRHDLVWYNNDDLTRAELVARLAHLEPSQPLRAKWQYNNLMFLTAGYLVEHLTGKSWEENVRERIFEPLGMSRSNFSVLDSQESDDFALPYAEREGKVVQVPFRVITNMGPAGSVNSSAEEMARWLLMNLQGGKAGEGQILRPATLAEIHAPQMVIGAVPEHPEISEGSYALGWVVDTYRGHRRLHHGGGIDGFTARIALFPQDGLGVVVLSNKGGSGLPEILVRHAADRILGLEPIDWNGQGLARRAQGKEAEEDARAKKETVRKPGTRPAHDLDEYAGEYHHPGYGSLKVELAGDHLVLTYNGITTPLEHWHYEVFNAREGAKDPALENVKFVFRTDVQGNVAAVEAPFEARVQPIAFARKPDPRLFDPAYLARFVGEYDLAGQALSVGLSGTTLTLTIPGQPQYHLVPGLGEEFSLKEASVVRVRFETDAQGEVARLLLHQPQGIFTAERRR